MSITTNINDLNDDCFKHIFLTFNLKEKLVLESVCLRWQRVIIQILNGQKILKIGLKLSTRSSYLCNDVEYPLHECRALRQSDDWIDKYEITDYDLCSVLVRCPNIQYLYVCDCIISVSTLEWIVSQLNRIKCLTLIAIQGINILEWIRVWKALAQNNLIHFTLSDNHFADIDITELIEESKHLQELHLAYYRRPLMQLFGYLNENFSKLSLIECFRTNLESMKALVYGKANNIKELVIYKVPTYDENILSEFIGIKMSQLKRFSYLFDSPVPHIQPIECLNHLQHLSILSNDQYGIDLSSLITKTMSNVIYLQLNVHFDPYMLRNLDDIFPNVEILEFSFDRICCNCEPNININQNINNINANNNPNNLNPNAGNENNQNEANNNNLNQNNDNFIDDLNDDEPYVDDNCLLCSEKCVIIFSRLQRLKCLRMNGERIKESALKAIPSCLKLNQIIIDNNCKDLNLKTLMISCISLALKNKTQRITLRISDNQFSKIKILRQLPQNFKIFNESNKSLYSC